MVYDREIVHHAKRPSVIVQLNYEKEIGFKFYTNHFNHLAERPKFTQRTKHIALKYYDFRQFVANDSVQIKQICILEQNADFCLPNLFLMSSVPL